MFDLGNGMLCVHVMWEAGKPRDDEKLLLVKSEKKKLLNIMCWSSFRIRNSGFYLRTWTACLKVKPFEWSQCMNMQWFYVCMHEEYKYSLSLIAVIGRESGLLDPQNANESLYSCFHAVKSLSLTFFCLSPICSGLAKITSTVVTHGAVS